MRGALKASSWFPVVAWLFFFASVAYVASRPLFTTQVAGNVRMRDFVSPYTGARCLLVGCDPYDLEQIKTEFRNAGGTEADHAPWDWEPPVYPPSSLIVLTPFALFPFHAARVLWFECGLALFCGGMIATIYITEARYRAWAVLLCALLLPSRVTAELVGTGQPSAAAIGLATIAFFLLLKGQSRWAAVLLLGVSLALKPQVGIALFLILLLRRPTSRAAILAGLMAALLMAAGVFRLSVMPGSRSWLVDYRTQISSSVTGGVNDPGWSMPHGTRMLNMQASLAGFLSRRDASVLAWGFAGLLLLLWAVSYLRNRESIPRIRDALAAIVCIALLPIYHRDYDLPMLMLTFPALIGLCVQRSMLAAPVVVLTLGLLLSPLPLTALWGHFSKKPATAKVIPDEKLRILLLARQEPLLILCLSVLYTIVVIRDEKPS